MHGHTDEILEHQPLRRTDGVVVLGQIGIRAGVGRQDGQGPTFNRASNLTLRENPRDFGQSLFGRLPADTAAVHVGQRTRDAVEQAALEIGISHAANLFPEDHREIPEVVAADSATVRGQPVGVRRSASGPCDSLPLHKPRSHQAVESLPNSGRRHAQPIRELTDLEGGIAPKQVQHGGIGLATCVHLVSHTCSFMPLAIFDNNPCENFIGRPDFSALDFSAGPTRLPPRKRTFPERETMNPAPKPPPLTDSVWLWATLFSLMALAGVAAIAGKFDIRQRQIEGRFLGRQQSAIERDRRAAGLPAVDLADSARDRAEVAPTRIVPLWTLAVAAGLAAVGSLVMLAREQRSAVVAGRD